MCNREHKHIYSTQWSSDERNHWHEITCCQINTSDKIIDEDSHKLADGNSYPSGFTCTVCGYQREKFSKGLKYEYDNQDDYALKGLGSCTDTNIIIPAVNEYGRYVSIIGMYALSSNNSITSITIPDTVTVIKTYAFLALKSLKSFNYTGTKEQWKRVGKRSGWNSTNCYVLHCSDVDIELSHYF